MFEGLKGLVVGITEGRKYSNMLIYDLYQEYNKIESSNKDDLKEYRLKAIKKEITRRAQEDSIQICSLFYRLSKEEADRVCQEMIAN